MSIFNFCYRIIPCLADPARRSSLGLKAALVVLHIVYAGTLFLFYSDLIEKTKEEPWYTAIYLLLFVATLIQYFVTSCSSPGYVLDAMRDLNEKNSLYRRSSMLSKQPASSKSGSFVITVEGSRSERNITGSNVTSWTKLVLDMYPPGTSIRYAMLGTLRNPFLCPVGLLCDKLMGCLAMVTIRDSYTTPKKTLTCIYCNVEQLVCTPGCININLIPTLEFLHLQLPASILLCLLYKKEGKLSEIIRSTYPSLTFQNSLLHEQSIAMIVTNVFFSLTIIVFGLGRALAGEIIVDFETVLCLWTGILYITCLKANISRDAITILLLVTLSIALIFLLLLLIFHRQVFSFIQYFFSRMIHGFRRSSFHFYAGHKSHRVLTHSYNMPFVVFGASKANPLASLHVTVFPFRLLVLEAGKENLSLALVTIPLWFLRADGFSIYLILTYQTTYELVRRRRIPYLRGIPERVYPFSKGVCRNLYDFCFARNSIYSLERLPTAMELEEKSRPYTCLDFLTGQCFVYGSFMPR
ncbi:hypothetical protein NC651_018229 [Populus alba x Populus x berolinensis]|nr:hypothetical protein NC651_018229 [Populus alba x Populus x berolinensis]